MGNVGAVRAGHSIRITKVGTIRRGETRVRSKRVLGAIALVAIVVAAISFAVVDVSTSAASGCLDSNAPCTDTVVPPIAVVCAI